MNSADARRSFYERIFEWALEEWDRELHSDFHLLSLVDGNAANKAVSVLRALPIDDRRSLTRALTKRFHPEACASRGIVTEAGEQRLLHAYDLTRDPMHVPPQRVAKDVIKELVAALKEALAFLGPMESLGRRAEWRYTTPVRTWRIVTTVEAVGRFGDCSYTHVVETTRGERTSQYLSLLSWLGVSSITKWRIHSSTQPPAVAGAMRRLCEHFLDAVPTLLEGTAVES